MAEALLEDVGRRGVGVRSSLRGEYIAETTEEAGLLGAGAAAGDAGGASVLALGGLEGEEVGVIARALELDGERAREGDSGRLKGEARGEPMPSGEGFFGDVFVDCEEVSVRSSGCGLGRTMVTISSESFGWRRCS